MLDVKLISSNSLSYSLARLEGVGTYAVDLERNSRPDVVQSYFPMINIRGRSELSMSGVAHSDRSIVPLLLWAV